MRIEDRTNGDLIRQIDYRYDAQGNRIAKTVLNDDPSVSVDEETYFDDDGRLVQQRTRTTTQPEEADLYIRDAQGNPLAINTIEQTTFTQFIELYEITSIFPPESLLITTTTSQSPSDIHQYEQAEVHVYGSQRLGLDRTQVNYMVSHAPGMDDVFTEEFRGRKQYELKNHLGNVLAVVSDKKTGMNSSAATGTLEADFWVAAVASANDYYPFGMVQEEKSYRPDAAYRYGFNGKEFDNEWKHGKNIYDYGARFYDPRTARFISRDPLRNKFAFLSPYPFAANQPVRGRDLQGEQLELSITEHLDKDGFVVQRDYEVYEAGPKDYISELHVYHKETNAAFEVDGVAAEGAFIYAVRHYEFQPPHHYESSFFDPAKKFLGFLYMQGGYNFTSEDGTYRNLSYTDWFGKPVQSIDISALDAVVTRMKARDMSMKFSRIKKVLDFQKVPEPSVKKNNQLGKDLENTSKFMKAGSKVIEKNRSEEHKQKMKTQSDTLRFTEPRTQDNPDGPSTDTIDGAFRMDFEGNPYPDGVTSPVGDLPDSTGDE